MIRFGTDGWRGIISDDFTFGNMRLVSQALARLINDDPGLPKKIGIGYDRRFLSREFAVEAARVMAGNGIEVLFGEDFLPTPVMSWTSKYLGGLCGSVVITASHNPPLYNGFKFKERSGCSAFPDTTKKIESILADTVPDTVKSSDFDEGLKKGNIKYFNPIEGYYKALENTVDIDLIGRFKGKVIVDPMNGSGSGYLASILKRYGVDVQEIHANRDPLFRGLNPEPIEPNLEETIKICRKEKPALAIILDGDSDRIGAVDEKGGFFNTQEVYTLVAWYFMKSKKLKGALAKTVSTTHMIDRLCDKFGVRLIETPIGFKHIAKMMIDGLVHLGGEESGGIGVSTHIPERDPILISLILIEMLGEEKTGIRKIYESIGKELGFARFLREDLNITQEQMDELNSKLKRSHPEVILGKKVKRFSDMDGFKFIFDDSWLLIRTSGTEKVLRLYAEAPTIQGSIKLLEHARRISLG